MHGNTFPFELSFFLLKKEDLDEDRAFLRITGTSQSLGMVSFFKMISLLFHVSMDFYTKTSACEDPELGSIIGQQ